MLMALLVLVGFGSLYMFVFDEGAMGGKKSMAAIVRDADKTIAADRGMIARGQQTLATIPELEKIASSLRATLASNLSTTSRIRDAKLAIASLETNIAAAEDEWEDYKNQYRAHIRSKAAGVVIPRLQLRGGSVLTNVEIRKVTAIGVDVRHQDGFKRIAYDELPKEMIDEYQFDEGQSLAERNREQKVRKQHSMAVTTAQGVSEEQATVRRAAEEKSRKERNQQAILAKTRQVQALQSDINRITSEIASAENEANAARGTGRMHLNKAGSFRGPLAVKQAQLANLLAEIARLRASL